jgi:SAM-dependent methyltransferase
MKSPFDDTDASWSWFGKHEPYFGVLTQDQYRSSRLEPAAIEAFYESGRNHVDRVMEIAEARLGALADTGTVVDFGCGVGRLLLPLSRRFDRAIGIDISPDMLATCQERAKHEAIGNITLLNQLNDLHAVAPDGYNLVNSHIVLQHITPKRGLQIIEHLIRGLAADGVAILHVTHTVFPPWRDFSSVRSILTWMRMHSWFVNGAINLLRGRRFGAPMPIMRMNAYPMGVVLEILYRNGCGSIEMMETNHDGNLGTIVMCRKALRKSGL